MTTKNQESYINICFLNRIFIVFLIPNFKPKTIQFNTIAYCKKMVLLTNVNQKKTCITFCYNDIKNCAQCLS